MKKQHLARAVVGAMAAICLSPLATAAPATAEDLSFYEAPASLPAQNGDIIRSEPARFYIDPAKWLEPDATVQRIMYRSTDRTGTPIAVTGTVLTPDEPWTGPGERPLVGHAAGTQGLGDACAPSRAMGAGTEYEGPMIAALLDQGYVVVITDYEGLGTEGLHTYMLRESQGHVVLDAIRAAQRLPGSGVDASNPVAISGYSQGGGAAASAAELAPTYAPEINLKGVVAGAPPADLSLVAEQLDGSLYASFMGYAVAAMAADYGIDLGTFLNTQGLEMIDRLSDQCTVESLATYPFVDSEDLTIDGQPITDLLATSPFREIVAEQLLGDDSRNPEVPVLINHSYGDDVIPYAVGRQLAQRWCDSGSRVQLNGLITPTHVGGFVAGIPATMAFLHARFRGYYAFSSCWRL